MPIGILKAGTNILRFMIQRRPVATRVLCCVLFAMPSRIALAEPIRTFANEIACEKARSMDVPTCRQAFASAQAQYEAATRSYPNRDACYRAFGPCMPWPARAGSSARFRPQFMGVSISDAADGKAAMPVIAGGRIKLALALHSLTAPQASSASSLGRQDAPMTDPSAIALCRQIEAVAAKEHLPPGFLARLLWQESSFRTQVVSPAGALGIAQFMPATAQERGLDNPFDAERAIATSAGLLRDLTKRFGNLGLAAAAYNGGPARVSGWLQGHRTLAAETQDYVRRVTGRSVDAWAFRSSVEDLEAAKPASCLEMAARLKGARSDRSQTGP